MGWKNVKDHYRIKHIVHVDEECICIGSGYIPKIIMINSEGSFIKRYGDSFNSNDDLIRYQTEMDADLQKLRELIISPDNFNNSIKVYTYENGEVIEKECEELGWPNCTHDGQLMYENIFSTSFSAMVDYGIKYCESGIRIINELLISKKDEISEMEIRIATMSGYLSELLKLHDNGVIE